MAITIQASTERPTRAAGDLLVVLARGSNTLLSPLPEGVVKELRSALRERDFAGSWGTAVVVPAPRGIAAAMVAVVGVGKGEEIEQLAEAVRRGLGSATAEARRHLLRHMIVSLPEESMAGALAEAAAEGVELANYRFVEHSERLAKEQRRSAVRRLTLLTAEDQLREVRAAVRQARQVATGVELARDIVNQPAQDMSPAALAEIARDIAKNSPNITVKILDRAQAKKAGFTAFLAVAQGSAADPYVIHLIYRPAEQTDETKKVFLVGKGVTFDSGGLSLKPADYMEDMKVDMAGAAAVLGAFAALDDATPNAEVHGVIAACENMPSGNAYRPGDVLTAKNGKTIEVLNTDAEGRLTLADALVYAEEFEPDAIVDLATLTGAAVVALGETVAGLWSNDEALQHELLAATDAVGEQVAAMPMPDEYRPQLHSQVADLRNIGTSRYGGAITAAMFLREFVKKTPWAHLDIAGPAYVKQSYIPYQPKGATGYGVRLLLKWLGSL